jgi:hypothetical protein
MKLGWNPLVNELVFIYIKHDDDDDDVCLSRCLVQSTSHDGSSVISVVIHNLGCISNSELVKTQLGNLLQLECKLVSYWRRYKLICCRKRSGKL